MVDRMSNLQASAEEVEGAQMVKFLQTTALITMSDEAALRAWKNMSAEDRAQTKMAFSVMSDLLGASDA